MDAKDWMRLGLAGLVMILTIGWLVVVLTRLDDAPQYNQDGTLIIDQYARAKDIFVAILPLATTVLGYAFGAAGKEKVEEKANVATADAYRARGVITALEANPSNDTVAKVRSQYPEFFEKEQDAR